MLYSRAMGLGSSPVVLICRSRHRGGRSPPRRRIFRRRWSYIWKPGGHPRNRTASRRFISRAWKLAHEPASASGIRTGTGARLATRGVRFAAAEGQPCLDGKTFSGWLLAHGRAVAPGNPSGNIERYSEPVRFDQGRFGGSALRRSKFTRKGRGKGRGVLSNRSCAHSRNEYLRLSSESRYALFGAQARGRAVRRAGSVGGGVCGRGCRCSRSMAGGRGGCGSRSRNKGRRRGRPSPPCSAGPRLRRLF